MNITTILPVSRPQYLDRVLESLDKQTLRPHNLIVIYDGPESGYLEVRNKVVGLPYDSVRCVMSENRHQAHTISDRRRNIVNIHNSLREMIGETDLIFSIEDDGILPEHALKSLVEVSSAHDDFGMVTGVELGRWGTPYVGAWKVDDIDGPSNLTSMTFSSGVEEIDACGLYCALMRPEYYKSHTFTASNGLGPDVNLGLHFRQNGFKNYIDWSVLVTHLTRDYEKEIEIAADSFSNVVHLRRLSGSLWESYK